MRQDKVLTVGTGDDQVLYTIHHFGAGEGVRLAIDLLKRVGPFLALAFAGGARDEAMGKMVRSLLTDVDSADTVAFIKALVADTEAKGSGLLANTFDVHFAGRLDHLVPLLVAVVEHNFASFLSTAMAEIKSRVPEKPSMSPTA